MFEIDAIRQQRLEDSLGRTNMPLSSREGVTESVVGGGFLVAAAGLWLLPVTGSANWVAAGILVVAMAAATRMRFDVGAGYTTPSQLAFVPLLFCLPAQLVPPAVLLTFLLSQLPEVLNRTMHPSRLLLNPANSWFSIGPALVLVAAGGHDRLAGDPGLLLALIAAQTASDLAAWWVRERLVDGLSPVELVRETAPVYAVDAALTPVAFVAAGHLAEHPWEVLALLPLLFLLDGFSRERRARVDSLFELQQAYRGTALVLGDVVEADDGYTGEHCRDVVRLALSVGQALALPPERMRNLEFAALLHDVGKVAIPKEIINKPGPLDPHEFEIVKTHTVEGQRMLARVGGFMGEVGLIVRAHHERWDGGGYPDGLAGEAIPLEARIVACCDTFSAITTTRSYRAAQSAAAAVEELRRCAGSQFDPHIVDVLAEALALDASLLPSGAAPFAADVSSPRPEGDRSGPPGPGARTPAVAS